MNNQNNFNFHQRIPNPTPPTAQWPPHPHTQWPPNVAAGAPLPPHATANQWAPAPPQPSAPSASSPWPTDYAASDMGTERDRQINLPGSQRYQHPHAFSYPTQQQQQRHVSGEEEMARPDAPSTSTRYT